MAYKVGIPRGLLFYDYYPLWNEFFNELGVEVVLSKKTNKEILNNGVSNSVDEACYPVKIFHGHVIDLRDKVDYLFIPKVISVYKREFGCPKILGLPEMVKSSIKDLPPIIDVNIDLRKSNINLLKVAFEIGKHFTLNTYKILSAYNKALKKYKEYLNLIGSGVLPNKAIENYNSFIKDIKPIEKNKYKILVLGHPYNVYDEYISMNLINKLHSMDIEVVTSDMVDVEKINYYIKQLPKRMFWTFGRKIVGSAFSLIEDGNIDGIMYISSFGCGLDSILIDISGRRARKNNIPFTLLTIDEHSGEAGVNTRIEAFIDMIKWRGKDESNVSTHG